MLGSNNTAKTISDLTIRKDGVVYASGGYEKESFFKEVRQLIERESNDEDLRGLSGITDENLEKIFKDIATRSNEKKVAIGHVIRLLKEYQVYNHNLALAKVSNTGYNDETLEKIFWKYPGKCKDEENVKEVINQYLFNQISDKENLSQEDLNRLFFTNDDRSVKHEQQNISNIASHFFLVKDENEVSKEQKLILQKALDFESLRFVSNLLELAKVVKGYNYEEIKEIKNKLSEWFESHGYEKKDYELFLDANLREKDKKAVIKGSSDPLSDYCKNEKAKAKYNNLKLTDLGEIESAFNKLKGLKGESVEEEAFYAFWALTKYIPENKNRGIEKEKIAKEFLKYFFPKGFDIVSAGKTGSSLDLAIIECFKSEHNSEFLNTVIENFVFCNLLDSFINCIMYIDEFAKTEDFFKMIFIFTKNHSLNVNNSFLGFIERIESKLIVEQSPDVRKQIVDLLKILSGDDYGFDKFHGLIKHALLTWKKDEIRYLVNQFKEVEKFTEAFKDLGLEGLEKIDIFMTRFMSFGEESEVVLPRRRTSIIGKLTEVLLPVSPRKDSVPERSRAFSNSSVSKLASPRKGSFIERFRSSSLLSITSPRENKILEENNPLDILFETIKGDAKPYQFILCQRFIRQEIDSEGLLSEKNITTAFRIINRFSKNCSSQDKDQDQYEESQELLDFCQFILSTFNKEALKDEGTKSILKESIITLFAKKNLKLIQCFLNSKIDFSVEIDGKLLTLQGVEAEVVSSFKQGQERERAKTAADLEEVDKVKTISKYIANLKNAQGEDVANTRLEEIKEKLKTEIINELGDFNKVAENGLSDLKESCKAANDKLKGHKLDSLEFLRPDKNGQESALCGFESDIGLFEFDKEKKGYFIPITGFKEDSPASLLRLNTGDNYKIFVQFTDEELLKIGETEGSEDQRKKLAINKFRDAKANQETTSKVISFYKVDTLLGDSNHPLNKIIASKYDKNGDLDDFEVKKLLLDSTRSSSTSSESFEMIEEFGDDSSPTNRPRESSFSLVSPGDSFVMVPR